MSGNKQYDIDEYMVKNVAQARCIAKEWLEFNNLSSVKIGLPEVDDRKDTWFIPIAKMDNENGIQIKVGEIVVNAITGSIERTTSLKLIKKRFKNNDTESSTYSKSIKRSENKIVIIPNSVVLGDSRKVLSELPPNSIQLVFTSPPYFNARPEYSEYFDYQEYLDMLEDVFVNCHSVLCEGRFLVVNVSPVLIRRVNRNSSSKRIAVPFDIHHLLTKIGYDFIDDIIWVKPEGAGWATGRGRRFAADRKPLQYKTVPITENILVYRKRTDKLIDWNIKTHYSKRFVEESKITGEYERTNVWHIKPTHSKKHPAVFPEELVEKVIKYYSFKYDCVLDPFAGSGVVGKVSLKLGRRFFLVDNQAEYHKTMYDQLSPLADRFDSAIIFEPDYDNNLSNFNL